MSDDLVTLLKMLAFLFAIFMFVHSDVFVDNVLNKISPGTQGRSLGVKAIILQGMFLVVMFGAVMLAMEGQIL